MVGFLGCHHKVQYIIEYGRHLFQDAIETNWATAKRAHMVLQDIERGKCTCRNPDKIGKVRIRNTARVIAPKQAPTQPKSSNGSNREKICQDFNTNNLQHSTDHILNGQIQNMLVLILFKWASIVSIKSKIALGGVTMNRKTIKVAVDM